MNRAQAAEHALKALELEREAVKHCDRLDNPEYVRLIRESVNERIRAESFLQ